MDIAQIIGWGLSKINLNAVDSMLSADNMLLSDNIPLVNNI
jgi:hypothetical protein